MIEVRYVGARSNNLPRALDLNQLDIRGTGFLADLNRARANLLLTGNPACTTAQNAGCQALTVFPLLPSGGLLTNATVQGQLIAGTPADRGLAPASALGSLRSLCPNWGKKAKTAECPRSRKPRCE